MELGLKNKNIIITGGGSNIGRSIVHAFAGEASNITIAELSPNHGEKVAAEVVQINPGGRVKVIGCDVTEPEQVEQMVSSSIAEFGSVDVLVNNVGWTVDRLFMDKPRDEWEKEVKVNLLSLIHI